jgi:hypothetical protein
VSKLHSPSKQTCQKGRAEMLVFQLLTSMLLIELLQENTATNFDDLGKLLLGGVAAAIVVAVGFTLVRFRMRDKKPPSSNFISINSEKQ